MFFKSGVIVIGIWGKTNCLGNYLVVDFSVLMLENFYLNFNNKFIKIKYYITYFYNFSGGSIFMVVNY